MPTLRERLHPALLRDVLAVALSAGGDYAEIYAEDQRGRRLRVEDRQVQQVASASDVGVGVRVLSGHRSGYACTNTLDRAGMEEAARAAGAAVRGDGARGVRDLTRPERRIEHPVKREPQDAATSLVADLAQRADAAARDVSGEVTQVTVVYEDVTQHVVVATSDGRLTDDRRVRTRLGVTAVAARDGVIRTGSESPGTGGGHELFDAHPPEQIGRDAAVRAVTMLDARPAPTGEMPAVLWRGDAGVLFHEAIGHGLEGDTVARGASLYAGRRDEQFASPLVTAVDDATVVNGWGSYAFDDEGTPAQRTVMLDEGVLTGYLSDRRSAIRLGVMWSGNGRRQGYRHQPAPRMTNTHVVPGDTAPEEAIASLDEGILCKRLGGGQVDPATGDFVFGMTEAYRVEGGEITHPVRGASLVGNGPEVLRAVDVVCHDFAVRQGVCDKGGQSVPVSFGTPTLRIGRITVGGTA